jgi:cyclophilin family peptidyl-prolyl cis-trans isomerase
VELYERHFFDGSHFFRAIPGFLVQFGISYTDDEELQKFAKTPIPDDPKHVPEIEFHPGIISYAGSGPNSRNSQMFISYGSAKSLGTQPWETPIGKVIEGMENAEQFYSYGDMPPWGKGPEQGKIHGNPDYIPNEFPLIDSFIHCKTERLTNGGATDTYKVLRKSDGVSDEEHFKKQRQAAQEAGAEGATIRLNKPSLESTDDPATILIAGAAVLAASLAVILLLFRSRQKVTSKTS